MVRIALLLVLAAASVLGGYVLGFRQAWDLGLMANAPVRGAIAVAQLRSLENENIANVRAGLDTDIDSGLIWWAEIERFPLYGMLDALSGHSVVSENLGYVRRVATHRKTHASPLKNPKISAAVSEAVREEDPEMADQLIEGGKQAEAAIDLMVRKYAE
jgi:hypothetical protein